MNEKYLKLIIRCDENAPMIRLLKNEEIFSIVMNGETISGAESELASDWEIAESDDKISLNNNV